MILEAGRLFILKQSGTLELGHAGQRVPGVGADRVGAGGGHGGADGGDAVDAGRNSSFAFKYQLNIRNKN